MIKAIHHTGIWVHDIDKLVPFYCDVLGMQLMADLGVMSDPVVSTLTGVPDAKVKAVMLQIGGQVWEFLQLVNPPAKPLPDNAPYAQVGRGHIAFEVDDIYEVYKRLEEKGVRLVCPPQQGENVRFFYLEDPEGQRVEMFQPLR